VSYLISAVLLVLAAVTATTGLAADLWDLNDFVYHKYAGYTLAALALAHVYLHWGRLVAYARWRLGKHPGRRGRVVEPPLAPVTAEREAQQRQVYPASEDGQAQLSPALGRALRTLSSRRPGGDLP
jgi:hypothetical protein